MASTQTVEKRGHVCPPSAAKHPSDRWETAFVYSFICKFTNLRNKIEGFDSPIDLELALITQGPDPILEQVLARFILNLRPTSRTVDPEHVAATVHSVLVEFNRLPERSVFWNDAARRNVDPLAGVEGGYWGASWDTKLLILRQLVEWQLCRNPELRDIIDTAWGVKATKQKKKPGDGPAPSVSADDPHSRERLAMVPLGQDNKKRRFWVVDNSARLYMSSNPWKVTAQFQTVATSKEEYLNIIEELKQSVPAELKPGERRTKLDTAHLNLVKLLEGRLPAIDAEIARIAKVRKKIAQRDFLLAQAELRTTRTRRQTRRPDYVYQIGSDNDDEDYTFQDDGDDDEDDEDDFASTGSGGVGRRRSARNASKRGAETREWRGERRSLRLGANAEMQLDGSPPLKRSRTSSRSPPAEAHQKNGKSGKAGGAVKPNEVAIEQLAGRKKSKFWFYAVEPGPDDTVSGNGTNGVGEPSTEASVDGSLSGFGGKGARSSSEPTSMDMSDG